MSTFREIVYMVLDRCKLSGDDSYVEPEHVLFLVSKLRAYILTSKYQKMKSPLSPSNLQTISVTLESADNCCSGMTVMRSVEKIPTPLLAGSFEAQISITSPDSFGCGSRINYVTPARFETAGLGRFGGLSAYATIGPDGKLYIKSKDSDIDMVESLSVSAVFEDAEKAAQAQALAENDGCSEEAPCDVMDMNFPLEEGLVTLLIENAVQAIGQMSGNPKDDKNSANDELDSLISYLNTLLKDRYRKSNQASDVTE